MTKASFLFSLLLLAGVATLDVSGTGCFHGSTQVYTREHGAIRLDELVRFPHESVLTAGRDGRFKYSKLRFWLHADPAHVAVYLEINVAEREQLLLTPEHLIYTVENGSSTGAHTRKLRRADELGVGDFVLVVGDERDSLVAQRVSAIFPVVKRGVYAPMTAEGSLIVNDVLASAYTSLKDEPVQKFVFDAIVALKPLLTYVGMSPAWFPGDASQQGIPTLAAYALDVARNVFGIAS